MKNRILLIIVLSVVWIVAFYFYNRITIKENSTNEHIKDSTYTKHDTIKDTVYLKKPVPVYRDTGSYKLTVLPADTQAILKALNQLNELRVYNRPVIDNDSLKVSIIDTVQYNELGAGKATFWMTRKTITHTITTTKTVNPSHALFIGVNATYADRLYIAPSITYQTDRHQVFLSATDKIFTIGYNYQVFKR